MSSVLIVDDAKFMRNALSNLLTNSGFTIIGEAENGKDAYLKYKELKPDLVTMDITMPDHDGLEGLKLIMEEFPDANVIMCSAMGQQAMVLEAVKLGAKDFIVKPFHADKVIESIRKILK